MKVTVNMATFPPRKGGLKARLDELAPQCDILRVYLNCYSEWPREVPLYENIEYVLGDDIRAPQMGSQGKLAFIDPTRREYYLTVDDDIFYPADYVERIVAGCERYRNKAVVGYHGCRFNIGHASQMPEKFWAKRSRRMFMYSEPFAYNTPVHQIGNATMCCVPNELGMAKDDLIRGPLNSGDDADVAVWCQEHNVPMLILKRSGKWLKPDNRFNMLEANHRTSGRKEMQNVKLHSWKAWRLMPMPPRRQIGEQIKER